MRSLWHIWQEAISSEVCNQIEAMPKVPLRKAKVGYKKEHNHNLRRSDISGFPYNSAEALDLNTLVKPFITMANRENFGFKLNNFYEFQYTEYKALSLLYCPNLTSIHDSWKNHSFDYMDLCRQSNVSTF